MKLRICVILGIHILIDNLSGKTFSIHQCYATGHIDLLNINSVGNCLFVPKELETCLSMYNMRATLDLDEKKVTEDKN